MIDFIQHKIRQKAILIMISIITLSNFIFGRFPDAVGKNGMVVSSNYLASQVGIDILKSGGNAIDAAIAANAVLGLMEPTGCGIGGDLFAIIWSGTKDLFRKKK